MAARKRKINLTDNWKAKIKASMIVNRLYEHSLGMNDMSQTQIKAARIVLNKLVPDLNRTEHAGDKDAPVQVQFSWQK